MRKQLFAKKPLSLLLQEMEGENRLRRILGPVALTSLGIGAIIGTGIFVLTGVAAADKAGPAIMLSFAVAGFACIFAAMCYSEFASMVPVAGSAYTYAYATLGELFAWIIGWDLILEYAVASATVAHGWSHYFQDFIGIFGIHLPLAFTRAPFDYNIDTGAFYTTGALFDLPAILIALLITAILVKGIRESAGFNTTMVVIKLAVVLLVIVLGFQYIKFENWIPFAPYGYSGLSVFGKTVWGMTSSGGAPVGVLAGAAMIFFAYIGFDSVSTHAEEAKNPRRDVPIGIITSLIVCTVLYILVAGVITGMVPYNKINIDAPISDAFRQVGLGWAQFVISAGAMAGITSVLLVMMLSQPRVFLAMARDGLVPESIFGAIHDKFRTPWKSTIITGIFVAILGGLLPLRILAELVNIGTLFAFVVVCSAVLIMRRMHPNAERPFKAPLYPFTPIMGIITCLML
ncbi:MAG: amino acid permease, partial [Ignavibacteriales bacterium]|nr:amino acid permease [Ignavibacteriales bacterium]